MPALRDNIPPSVTLMTQRIGIEFAPNLHHAADPHDSESHAHRAYGIYEEATQVITLDDALEFERLRETFLHENLHAMLSISQLDTLIEAQAEGFGEHLVATLAPVLLAWIRDNKFAVSFLQEVQ